jgi:BirA family transcriptional regulator, biotin operon repressor / biotin---[acetyl-CoA-carboxylase] ligase
METSLQEYKVHHFPVLESTNSKALEMIKSGVAGAGDVIYTVQQERGRGQREKVWESEAGMGLTLSIVLNPGVKIDTGGFSLSILTALAAHAFVAEELSNTEDEPEILIKWPNDILINGRKAGGILIENIIQGDQISWSVVGVGINLNGHPEIPGRATTSLIKHTKKNLPPELALNKFLIHFQNYWERFRGPGRKSLLNEYKTKLFGLGKEVKFRDATGEFTGKPEDVTETGKIRVKNLNDGIIREYYLQGLEWLI